MELIINLLLFLAVKMHGKLKIQNLKGQKRERVKIIVHSLKFEQVEKAQ